MSQQSQPVSSDTSLSISSVFGDDADKQALIKQLLREIVALRNTVDDPVTKFNAHTHAGGEGTAASGTVTIIVANTDAGDTVTINGVTFTAAEAEDTAAGEFDISGTDTAAGDSLVACIEASTNGLIEGVVTSVNDAGEVTITAVAEDTSGNAITLASSDADGLVVSGETLENGAAGDVTGSEFNVTAPATVRVTV